MAIDRMLPGNLNRAELEALMNTPAKKKLPGNLNEAEIKLLSDNAAIKESIFEELMEYPEIRELPIEEIIKKVNEIFEQRAIDVSQAPAGNLNKSETNLLMGLIDKGVKDTKREGIMTAAREDGDFDYLLEQLRNLNPSDDNYGVDQEILLQDIRRLEELNPTVSIRPKTDYSYADGGIVHLAPGGPVTKGGSTLKPSTYTKPFEDFLKDIGFTKIDEKTGKIRGSKTAFNDHLKKLGIKIGSPEATAELNNLLKKAGKRPYISVDLSQKGLGQSLIDEITGTQAGKPNVRDIRQSTANKIEEIRLDANDKFGRNPTKKKYDYIKKQIVKFFPKVAGTTALAQFIAGKALGFVGAFMPSEADAATLYDDEGNMKEGIMSQIEEQNKMKVITE